MFLTLLKRAVKAALHDAVEEWALESGLPQEVVKEVRAQRLALTAKAEARADARAAQALGVEDDMEERPTLPMPSAARVTTADASNECPPPGGESALLHWVHCQRERQIAWSAQQRPAARRVVHQHSSTISLPVDRAVAGRHGSAGRLPSARLNPDRPRSRAWNGASPAMTALPSSVLGVRSDILPTAA